MEKEELDIKIEDAARSILSFARRRTNDDFDAEDLAQDIILELYRSRTDIRCDDAFYGFLWSMAENVARAFLRKHQRKKTADIDIDSVDSFLADTDAADAIDGIADGDEQRQNILRLRRELSLLSEKYRRAAVLYYIRGMSCAETARELSVSESMVKYLLFKSRRKLLEGFNMERNYGKQSYDPKKLSMYFWGGRNHFTHLADSKTAQNILCACYNDKLTEQQISLEIGVALPYMEDELRTLTENGLLCRDGNKYYTNFVIFTDELSAACARITSKSGERIADMIAESVRDFESVIRDINFVGADMNKNTYAWQAVTMLLRRGVMENLGGRTTLEFTVEDDGNLYILWGAESSAASASAPDLFSFGHSHISPHDFDESESEDVRIWFFDFPCNGEYIHHYFWDRSSAVNVFTDIASGHITNVDALSRNDAVTAADMVKRGYIRNVDGMLSVNCPVYTAGQYEKVLGIIDSYAGKIADEAQSMLADVANTISEHVPSNLRHLSDTMAYLRLFDDAISAPVRALWERGFLLPPVPGDMLPTTFVVI